MPLTYQRAQEMWARKAKHKDFKAVERDMRMRKEPDGTFVVHIKGYSYTDGKFERIEHPMAVLTPDNVLTLTLEDRPDQTEAARLRAMLGLSVYLDARGYSQYESSVRIFLERGKSIPFHTGLQFKMSENGHAVCLNPQPDRKVQIKQEAANQVKASTAVLRKLTIAMARMGAFDEHIKEALKGRWRFNAVGKIEEVTYHEPTANDAEIVFTHGLASANTPDKHQYVKGQYVEIDEQERFATLRTRAIENGMKMLRKHIYDTNDGYEKITVSSV